MDEFRGTIDSLGYWSLDNLPGVNRVEIYADAHDGRAHMELFLAHDTWQGRDKVIRAMVEIRAMFIDDLAIDYAFGEVPNAELDCSSQTPAYVYA